MSEAQFNNFAEYKDACLEGVAGKAKGILSQIMENSHKEYATVNDDFNKVVVEGQVNESTATGSTVTSNITRYDTLFMPLIRRTMPALLAMDLVGVQPINTARGIVRTLRTRYSEDTETTNASGVNAVASGTEASGQNVFEKYSKLKLGDDYDAVDGLDPFAQTVYLEGNRGKPMDLEVLTQQTEPLSRKLSAAYSLESEDDLQSLDGLDIEQELTSSLGDEIVREIDRELITELKSLAGTVESFDFATVDGRYAGEKLSAMAIAFDNLSTEISIKTQKGGATWMVVSPKIFTGLKNAANGSFVPVNQGDLQIGTSLFVGMWGSTRVYVDPYATADTVLMGYKGSSEIDTGFIYSPYIPLSSTGVVVNPETMDKRLMLRTRYGLTSFTDDTTSLGDSPDYYARANVANLQLGFTN